MSGPRIGVDIGGTKVLGLAIDDDGAVLAEHRVPTPGGAEALVEAVVDVVRSLDAAAGGSGAPGAGPIGVGAPGLISRRGEILFAPNLRDVRRLPLAERVAGRIGAGRSVVVDNDANCAGWAEVSFGAAAGAAHAVVVTLGTGIGGGIVCDGRLLRGAQGFAGEIGHMVVDPGGPLCPCGRSGCWERYASGSGLARLGREAAHAGRSRRLLELAGGDPESVRGEHVTRASSEGDPGALEVMERFAWWLASGLADLGNIFDPEVLVIGGGLVEAGEVLMAPTRRAFLQLVEAGSARPDISVRPAALGERAGAIGAAALAGLPGRAGGAAATGGAMG